MKIVFVSTIPATIYYFQKDVIRALQENGHSSIVISSENKWISLAKIKQDIKIPYYKIPFSRKISPLKDILTLVKLYILFKKLQPDIVYYSTPKAALLASLASWCAGVKFRLYGHRGVFYCNLIGIRYNIFKFLDKFSCGCSHKVVVNSQSNITYLLKNYICNIKKMGLLCNGSSHGVDSKMRFNPKYVKNIPLKGIPSNCVIFGFIGRIESDKGIAELIKAWRIFLTQCKDALLILVGPLSDSWNSIENSLIEEIKNESTIILLPATDNVEEIYKKLDIFVFPSYREGFPNAVLEASAMGLPVITTNALGCVDSVVEGETGVVIPVQDIDELANAMIKMYENKSLREKMGINARTRVLNEFDPKEINKELIYLLMNRKFKNEDK